MSSGIRDVETRATATEGLGRAPLTAPPAVSATPILIRAIETCIVDLPLRRTQQFSRFDTNVQSTVLIRISASNGIVGIGESITPCGPWWSGDTVETIRIMIDKYLAPLLIGEDAFRLTALMARLDSKVRNNAFAKTGLEMALLDLIGKTLDTPICTLLGGAVRTSLPVAWPLATGDSGQEIAEAEEMLARGKASRFKLKMGALPVTEDVRRATSIARSLEGRASVRVDPNEGWDEATAARAIRQLADVGIEMVEQPVARWNLEAMARLSQKGDTIIMIDEGVLSPHDMIEVVRRSAANLVSLKIMKSGGIRNAQAMAAIAGAAGLPVYLGTFLETSIGTAANMHLAASLENLPLGGEPIGPLLMAEDICVRPAEYRDHALWLPAGPGLGIEIDERQVERFRRA